MPEKTFKLVEVVGTSGESFARAVENAVEKASASLEDLRWFEVTDLRGCVADGKVTEFQVTLKVGFRLH